MLLARPQKGFPVEDERPFAPFFMSFALVLFLTSSASVVSHADHLRLGEPSANATVKENTRRLREEGETSRQS